MKTTFGQDDRIPLAPDLKSTLHPVNPVKTDSLELVSDAEAQAEKRIGTWMGLLKNAGAQMIGYRVLVGAELNRMKELCPHGKFQERVEVRFGLTRSTQQLWRDFSTAFLVEVETLKLPTIGNLKKINKGSAKAILEIIPRVMDGRGMVDFCREIKLLKEPTPDGGYRPDAERVQEFLAAVHPELAKRTDGTARTYEELEPKVQAEFRKWLAARPEPPEDIAKRAEDQVEAHNQAMLAAITGKWAMAISKDSRAKALVLAEKWVEKLKGLEKAKAETLKPETLKQVTARRSLALPSKEARA